MGGIRMPWRGGIMVYRWIVFVHVGAALVFMLAHGASASVAFRLRRERDVARLGALLDLSGASYWAMSLSFVAILATGITLGLMVEWWRTAWFWTSLVLFFAITFVMTPLVAIPYNKVRVALGLDLPMGRKWKGPAEELPQPEDVDELLDSSRPMVVAAVGVIGILIILWLMILKPF